MKPRLTYEFIQSQFEAEGYQLLSTEYKNAHQKLEYRCPLGHEHFITWNMFQQGNRCKKCNDLDKRSRYKLSYDFVKSYFEKEGYHLLSSKYKNNREKLSYRCPVGHEHSISFTRFQGGNRCAYCSGRIVTHEDAKTAFEAEGYTLLGSYQNSKKKIPFICPAGHKHSISYEFFRVGKRCAYCAGHVVTQEQVKAAFDAAGYQLLSEYKNHKTKLKYVCPEGHTSSMVWQCFSRGQRCVYCAKYGYNPQFPTRLYYLRFDVPGMLSLYKVGITNRTIADRVGAHDMQYCTVLLDKLYDDGTIPQEEERKILTRFAEFRYQGKPVLKHGGNTELFTRDVLMLDPVSAYSA